MLPAALLALLREQPQLSTSQDEHGYSLVHAAASYNHLNLLRALVSEFNAPVDLRDEDDETALFNVETVQAARCLVEELKLDPSLKGSDGMTAREKIEADGDYPDVVRYLKELEERSDGRNGVAPEVQNGVGHSANGEAAATPDIPPPPEGMRVTMGAMTDEAEGEADPEFRRRIEELAARDDFHTEAGQADLRRLVEEAVSGEGLTDERNVRARQE